MADIDIRQKYHEKIAAILLPALHERGTNISGRSLVRNAALTAILLI
ncbi:hypothetical protein PDE01_47100 [Paracoccus denitrificans]|nr:hypothetical protein PDE01_47100 [Paracoccus denitrificans]